MATIAVNEEIDSNELPPYKRARFAWMMPILALGSSIIFRFITQATGPSREVAMLNGVIFLGLIITGLVFTVRCFYFNSSHKKAIGHGIGGIIVNTLLILLIVVGVMALGKARDKARMAYSKSNLKNMGTDVAIYFSDGVEVNFPKDINKLELDPYNFRHPATGRMVSMEDIAAGKGDYIPVYKIGSRYNGSPAVPLFIEKPGIWENGQVFVVFEDGHVGYGRGKTVEEVLKTAR